MVAVWLINTLSLEVQGFSRQANKGRREIISVSSKARKLLETTSRAAELADTFKNSSSVNYNWSENGFMHRDTRLAKRESVHLVSRKGKAGIGVITPHGFSTELAEGCTGHEMMKWLFRCSH